MHASIISKKTLALTIATIFVLGAVSMALSTAEVNAAQKKATLNIVIQGGKEGKQGPKGDKGDPGAPGEPGVAGEKGETGAPGEPGAVGATGATGDPGPRGETGETGSPGPQGEQGPSGTVTINLCQAGSEGCQSIEAQPGDNITIGVNVSHEQGANETEPTTPPAEGNETVVTPPTGNESSSGNESGTVIPPVENTTTTSNTTTTENTTSTETNTTTTTPVGNETSSGNETTTTPPVEPIQCQPGTHDENGQCVNDVGFPPSNSNETVTGGNLTQ